MLRKKPFSGKQKKAQLQEKRERKREEEEREVAREKNRERREGARLIDSDEEGPIVVGASSVNKASPADQPSNVLGPDKPLRAGDKKPSKLRTQFYLESREEIEERKKDSWRPLDRSKQHESIWSTFHGYETRIPLPSRPKWDYTMTPADLERMESSNFQAWLAKIRSEYEPRRLSYFEANLEVWRQLWRVVERSDILVVVTDARVPLFHFPRSLYEYVVVQSKKPLVLVLNKADLVGTDFVKQWTDWFSRHYPDITVVPFSSYPADEFATLAPLTSNFSLGHALSKTDIDVQRRKRIKRYAKAHGALNLMETCLKRLGQPPLESEFAAKYYVSQTAEGEDESDSGDSESTLSERDESEHSDTEAADTKKSQKQKRKSSDDSEEEEPFPMFITGGAGKKKKQKNKNRYVGGPMGMPELDENWDEEDAPKKSSKKKPATEKKAKKEDEENQWSSGDEEQERMRAMQSIEEKGFVTIGMIGHPNVGKSSVINGLMCKKVVSTSRTPGHTKHFQTIFINPRVRLCDCPGLVFPIVDCPKEFQILFGIFPIAQVREPYSAIRFLSERIEIEKVLKLNLRDALEYYGQEDQPDPKWSPFLEVAAYAVKKGYLVPNSGKPDTHRAGLELLRDCLDGKYVLAFPPPQD